MAVCNLFNELSNPSGNFLMFSQYVEDITCNYTDGDNWKVVPTQFVALNIDYSTLKKDNVLNDPNCFVNRVLNGGNDTLNSGIPKYFQNCFENACAYARKNKTDWNPKISRNLFWNCMFDGKFITSAKYGSDSGDKKFVPEIVYYGDINMHSYNEHQGMGYGEIYCYIPTDAPKMTCQVVENNDRVFDKTNNSLMLEGYTDQSIENYVQLYCYNDDFLMSFDDDAIAGFNPSNDTKYNINTIVVLYSIFNKLNDNWVPLYTSIPLGIYFAGKFEDDGKLSNEVTKHVSTSYGIGTSYGLRLCTRLSATSAGKIINTDIITDDSGYTNICQLMTAMNANLSQMLEISKAAINTTQSYKETLASIKNNRTNVPYVKDVNGVDCWFVNGRFVSAVNKGLEVSCINYDESTIQKRLDNLMDTDRTNDYSFIEDPNGTDCSSFTAREAAVEIFDRENFPEMWRFNTITNLWEFIGTDQNGNPWPDSICEGHTGGTVNFTLPIADSTEVDRILAQTNQ